jgi:transcription initiation factor TFIIIB Brf1 subunit/transcription initiation factor TFIIB
MDISIPLPDLTCDLCNSTDIIETRQEYVCRRCGSVLELPKLIYTHPYHTSQLQYAPLGTTQIGSVKERLQHGNSVCLKRLSKLQSRKSQKELVSLRANALMDSIFETLQLPENIKPLVREKFKKIRDALDSGTKYRSPE